MTAEEQAQVNAEMAEAWPEYEPTDAEMIEAAASFANPLDTLTDDEVATCYLRLPKRVRDRADA